jgi:hypothetical protein
MLRQLDPLCLVWRGEMKIHGIEASFHHLGIPTLESKPGERFSERFGMYTSDSACKALRIQWHASSRTVPYIL